MKIPTNIPKTGAFYYHYKHNPEGPMNNYVYEVVGVAFHTEDDCRPEDYHMVIYRPIYESKVYNLGKFLDARPLEMWMGNVQLEDNLIRRFTLITDEKVIEELRELRDIMYP